MYLKNGCVYKLTIDGQEKVFNSEQELDAFLQSNIDRIKIDKLNKTLSIDLQAEAISKLEEAKIAYNSSAIEIIRSAEDPEETDIIYKIPHSLGITLFIQMYGKYGDWSQAIVTPFNVKNFKIQRASELTAAGLSEDQVNTILNNLIDTLWPEYGFIGTDIHKIFECVLSDTEIPKLKHLSAAQIESTKKQAQLFKDGLKATHGSNAKFFTEVAIKTKELDPNIKTLMEASGYDSLNGKIDLLVIDDMGQAHIYDYKTTRHDYGTREDWNLNQNNLRKNLNLIHSTTKLKVTNQLAAYSAILRQYGINVKSCNIVPIKLDIQFADDAESVIKTTVDAEGNTVNDFTISVQPTIYNIPQTNAGKAFSNMISMIPVQMEVSNEETVSIIETTNKLLPNSNLEANVEQFKVDLEYYKKHPEAIQLREIKKESPLYDKGYRYSFKTHGLPQEKWVRCKTKEELDTELNKFVEELRTFKTNELITLSDVISNCILEGGSFDAIAENFPEAKREFITQQFKKYIKQQWEFVKNPALNAAGFFIFRKDGISELVMVTNKQLLDTVNLGMGTSILGKKVKNANINTKEIFDANYGNIEIMKAMVYISRHQDLFKQFKIAEIRCINPWSRFNKEVTNINSSIIHNWNMLCMQNPELDIKQVDDDCFLDDITALLQVAQSKLELTDEAIVDFQLVPNAVDVAYNEQWFNNALKQMRSKFPRLANPENYNADDNVWAAYTYLYKALMASQGIYTVNEATPGEIFTGGGINPNGFLVSAGQFSPSANIRIFSQIHDQYVAEVRNLVYKLGQKFQRVLKDFYDEEKQYGALGASRDIFKSWFVLNDDGSIHEDFRLKNPNSHDFDGRPKARAALIEFIDLMYELRHPKPTDPKKLQLWEEERQIAWDNDDPELFMVPLTEARFENQRANLGWKQAIKNKWKQYLNLTQDVFAEDENKKGTSGRTLKEEFEIKNQSVYNKFRISGEVRKQKIAEHGVGFFEIDLEAVMNQALVAYCKEEVSKKYVPIFQGMRLSLQHMKGYENQVIQNTLDTFDKMLKSKFYGEPIMKEDLRAFWRYLNVLKKGFSVMTLGLNFNSMFRELLQGTFIGLSRSGVRMLEGLDVEHYLKGAGLVIKDAHKNFSSVSLLQQLNAQYGMANMSLSNIANQRRLDRFGIRNWNTQTLFWTASAPDFQHRMAVLVGKMMADGSWEAHSLDKDGILKYDWKKDKRFEAYANNRTDDPDYLYQKSLYMNYIREFNRIGYKKDNGDIYKEGDDLPMAYPPREQQSVKNFADLLYGHYDDESRALINDTFIGSFFLQYKTFITAKLEQWTMKPGVYNTEMLKQQYDPVTKEKLYVKVTYANEDKTGIPTRKIIKESDLTQEDKESGLIENYMRWEGQPMEGMWQSTMSFAKAIKHLDTKELSDLWKNPLKKSGLILALNDMLLCSLIMLILNALFSTGIGQDEWWNRAKTRREMRDENWFTQWSYKIAIGSFEDGPVFNVVKQMFSDVNPPLITSLTKLIDTTTGLVIGDKTLAEAATQQIGAIREFQGMVAKIQDTK